MITKLYIVRHAEAEGNVKRIFHGWTDSNITEKGHLQAQKLADRMENEQIDLIISSPLTRTKQTTSYTAERKNIEMQVNENLKEINGGDWEGQNWSDLPVKWPRESEDWDLRPHIHQMPNGESMVEFQQRKICAINEIIKNNCGKSIMVVCHGTGIKALLCYFKELSLEEMVNIKWCENTAISVIEYDDELKKFNILLEGDVAHLDEELATVKNQGWVEELEERIKLMKEGR